MYIGYAHSDDFFFQPHLHAVKGHGVRPGFLVFECGQARVSPQSGQHGVHARFQPGNRAVDAFSGQQQRALHAIGFAARQQRRLQVGKVGQFDEFIQGGGEEAGHGGWQIQAGLQRLQS